MSELLLVLVMLLGPPRLDGWAVHYDECVSAACVFRNGEPFALDALCAAVDTGLWSELRGKRLLIVSSAGRMAMLRVCDSGYLARAGMYQGLPFVIDVPKITFGVIFQSLETQSVWVWVLP